MQLNCNCKYINSAVKNICPLTEKKKIITILKLTRKYEKVKF